MIAMNIVWFLFGLVLLAGGAIYLIKSLTKIGIFLKLSPFIIGFFVLALGTSIPELFIAVTSAVNKSSVIALGNVLGANIVNLTLALGLAGLIANGVQTSSKTINRDTWIMFALVVVPIFLLGIDGVLGRIDGAILILMFIIYTVFLIKTGNMAGEFKEKVSGRAFSISLFVGLVCFAFLYFGASLAVEYSEILANDLGIPSLIIGLVILGIGTALPEIIASVKAAKEGLGDLAVGDVIGSVAVNSSLVLGVAALIYPIAVDFLLFSVSAAFLIIISFLFITFLGKGGISRKEAAALVMFHLFFVIVSFYLGVKGI